MEEFYIFFGRGKEGATINPLLKKLGYSYKNFDEEYGAIHYENNEHSAIDLILTNKASHGLNEIIFYSRENACMKLKEVVDVLKEGGFIIKSVRDIKNKPVDLKNGVG